MDIDQKQSKRTEFLAGAKATFPLVVGAIPFGIIFGAFASSVGLSKFATQGMSLIVFAGSSQFIAATLISDRAGILLIIFTTLIVNLRHMLYAATLAPHLKGQPQKWLVPLGFWLTDESFVVMAQRYQEKDSSPYKHWYFLGSAMFMYTNWQVCTLIGITAGQYIDDPLKWGLDYAMIVTFIGMLVPMIKSKSTALALFTSGTTAYLLRQIPNQLGLLIAAFLGIAAGVVGYHLFNETMEHPDDATG
jgi:4-azaleucine resistance transporter AzlC